MIRLIGGNGYTNNKARNQKKGIGPEKLIKKISQKQKTYYGGYNQKSQLPSQRHGVKRSKITSLRHQFYRIIYDFLNLSKSRGRGQPLSQRAACRSPTYGQLRRMGACYCPVSGYFTFLTRTGARQQAQHC
jgi:hypothetical protein